MKKSTSTKPTQISLLLPSSGIREFIKANAEQEKPTKPAEPASKIHGILMVLLSGKSLNRFEAERHFEHCLHSTISSLANNYGIKIDRHYETVKCVRGSKTTQVKRYSLDRATPDNVKAARALIEHFERKAKAAKEESENERT